MGTKAIFKVFNEGKFVIGSWVKYDGGITSTSIFPYFLNKLKYDVDKKSIYDTINQFILDNKFRNVFKGTKKDPFFLQMNDSGMTDCNVLFWETSMSDKKLLSHDIWGEFIYEFRFNRDGVKIKVNYIGHEKTYTLGGYWNTTSIIKIVQDANKWVDEIEYGLNDCNCGEEEI